TSLQRLSSGLRVNSAKDDAAGLAIATGMTAQIRGGNQAIRNANDGISLAQTAEGALSQIEANMQRMRELAVQGANGTVSGSTNNMNRIKAELDQLGSENARLIAYTKFNGNAVFSATSTTTMTFQVGANNTANDKIAIRVGTAAFTNAAAAAVTFANATDAGSLIANLDTELNSVASMRANLGASQNRFGAVVANLQTYVENLSASRGRIIDTDFADETANMTRNQIIQQAGTAMLAQANQLPSAAMSLLR
ncbi:MAG: flagellin FliC, partial [Laribacter sp.]|nr:flagellin FliC [Laribacter sp.]